MLTDRQLARLTSTIALAACATAVTELAEEKLIAMVEPFVSRRVDGQSRTDLTAVSLL